MKKIFIATIIVVLVFALPVFAEEQIITDLPTDTTEETADTTEEITHWVDDFKQDVAPVLVSLAAAFSGFATILYFFGKSSAKLKTLFTGASDTYKAVSTKVIETQQSIVGIKENCTNAIKDMGVVYLDKINALKDENTEKLSDIKNATAEQIIEMAKSNQEQISAIFDDVKSDIQKIKDSTKDEVISVFNENKKEFETLKNETAKAFNILSEEFACVMQVLKVAYGNNAELSKTGNAEIIHKLIKEFENKFSEVGNDKETA